MSITDDDSNSEFSSLTTSNNALLHCYVLALFRTTKDRSRTPNGEEYISLQAQKTISSVEGDSAEFLGGNGSRLSLVASTTTPTARVWH
ncbi:hypothetical protein QR680_005617 [Steinernema hermaphroditum]|uniref:Uncharacterized protein n=1 Tax=Steinernema hermaphroditum TaxID=289476 RepID=A0AA39LVR0_9BILA|nr:hypothetical protein QR680_005617 [Steinernema hermaphroditum]